MNEHFLQFQREKTALKYFLIGRGYHQALKALGFVERYNVGLRKDGVTPSLHHEVQIALSVSQVKDVSHEELCIVASLLHDVQENHQIPSEDIEREFGQEIRNIVWKLTKKFAGEHKNKKDYINGIAICPVASIVKGLDRVNNLHSMIGVFSLEKMAEYAYEASIVFLPMLKRAGKLFPEQQSAYHSISQQMKQAIAFANAYVKQGLSLHAEAVLRAPSFDYQQLQDKLRDAETLVTRLQESNCSNRINREAFLSCMKAIQTARLTATEVNTIRDALRHELGVSELDLYHFSNETVDPIMDVKLTVDTKRF